MKKRNLKNLLLISSTLLFSSASLVSLVSCGETEKKDDDNDDEKETPVVEVTSVAISNKSALEAEWKVGDQAREIVVSLSPDEAKVSATDALASGDLKITSSDTSILTVSSFTLTPVAVGSVTVEVSYKTTLTDSVTLEIKEQDPLEIPDSISTVDGFISTFKTTFKAAQTSKYGVATYQKSFSSSTEKSSQTLVTRTTKEVKKETSSGESTYVSLYDGIQGDFLYTYQNSGSYDYINVEKVTEDNSEEKVSEIENKYSSEFNESATITGNLSLFVKYDSTQTDETTNHQGLKNYEVTSTTTSYTVKVSFYQETATDATWGSCYSFDYTYTLNADLLPTKVEVTREYASATSGLWDFDTHSATLEDGKTGFRNTLTYTSFDYTAPVETAEGSYLFDVSQYLVSSLDSTKLTLKKYDSSTWQYVETTQFMVGDTILFDLQDGAYAPSTALDSDSIVITQSSNTSVISLEDDTPSCVGAGTSTLTFGTVTHPSLCTLDVTVIKNPNVGTEDDPVEAYFSSWYDLSSTYFDYTTQLNYETWTYDYTINGATFTVGDEAHVELCFTNQTGVVKFDDFNSKVGVDSTVCTVVAADYSTEYQEAGSGYFTLTFTPLKEGTTTAKIYTSADEYFEIPITVNAASSSETGE